MRRLALVLSLALLPACAALKADATGEVSYADDAKANYDLGRGALEDGRQLDAIKYFEHTRNTFPYSTFAALADLGIADANFDREKYTDAIDGYRNFLKLHPRHEKADYAQFRIALSNVKDMPSDFILFPPPTQKDQAPVRRALSSMNEFLRLYPDSSFAPEAKKYVADLRKRLAEHELYVADFYLHRDRYRSAVGRLQRVVDEFPGLGLEGEALYKLGKSYVELKENDKARAALQRLVKDFPDDPHRADAEALLRKLG